jgi:hypothetical protein
MLALIAFVCFLLAAFGVDVGKIELIPTGLAFIALALLFGNWPMGLITTRNQ